MGEDLAAVRNPNERASIIALQRLANRNVTPRGTISGSCALVLSRVRFDSRLAAEGGFMRVWRIHALGEQLHLNDVEVLEVRPGSVLVRVENP